MYLKSITLFILINSLSISNLSAKELVETDKSLNALPIPHLWWGHEALSVPIEQCLREVEETLSRSNVLQTSVNEEYKFVYGSKGGIRVGIQCVSQSVGSLAYINVAGNSLSEVEALRNKLAIGLR